MPDIKYLQAPVGGLVPAGSRLRIEYVIKRLSQVQPQPLREADGLAMSSRNRYLSANERTRAPAIFQGLRAASRAFARGERDRAKLERLALAPIEAAFDNIDYAKVADADDLSDPGPTAGPARRG